MQICRKETNEHNKLLKNQQNPDICQKLLSANDMTPNACFFSPGRPNSDTQIGNKWFGQNMSVQSARKAFNMAFWNPPKI